MDLQKLLQGVHPEWQTVVMKAINTMDASYLHDLTCDNSWLPGSQRIFAAFSVPLSSMTTILLGESPYPRAQSANGYAFWDAAVQSLWSDSGLSKEVNRATSLRNFIKMLLVARGDLGANCSQESIAALDRSKYVSTANELFNSMLKHGFLLLNADLVYEQYKIPYHAKRWRPFMDSIFTQLKQRQHKCTVLLFGKVANQINITDNFPCVIAPHPYNISFIHNTEVLAYFKQMDLLRSHA